MPGLQFNGDMPCARGMRGWWTRWEYETKQQSAGWINSGYLRNCSGWLSSLGRRPKRYLRPLVHQLGHVLQSIGSLSCIFSPRLHAIRASVDMNF